MSFPTLIQGIIIGFSIAAPIGPIGIICMRRTLAGGTLAGFVSGLGAATADMLYGAVAAYGLTIISAFLISQSEWLRFGGGLFLVFLGAKTMLSSPKAENSPGPIQVSKRALIGNYFSTFVLTASNPLTILSFSAVFTGFGSRFLHSQDFSAASLMVLGIFLGSACWWLLLTYLVSIFKNRITRSTMIWINRIAGILILAFGVVALITLRSILLVDL